MIFYSYTGASLQLVRQQQRDQNGLKAFREVPTAMSTMEPADSSKFIGHAFPSTTSTNNYGQLFLLGVQMIDEKTDGAASSSGGQPPPVNQ
eukprot:1684674-Amphidinium_carterae.1